MLHLRGTIFFMIMILLWSDCSDSNKGDKIVAKIGKEEIRFDEFRFSYNLYPHYQQNSTVRQSHLQHLDYMIEKVHLKIAAEKEDFDKSPEVQEKIEYIKQKEMLKRLYEKNVLEKINISDGEAWEEYKRSNIQIKMRHLFTKTSEQANYFYHQLQHGVNFSDLARTSFRDSTLANNGGDLGFLTLTDLDPLLVDSVSILQLNKYSKPLRSSYGYHIVLIEDIKQAVFLSREYFNQNKDLYVRALRNRRATLQSAEYVTRVLRGKSIDINPPIFHQLLSVNQKIVPERVQEYPFAFPNVTDRELQQISHTINEYRDSVLVRFNGGQWTVNQLVERLKKMPPLDRPIVNRESELINRIIDMVRDEFLLKEAFDEEIDHDALLKKNLSKWEKELLAEEYKRRIYWVEYKEKDQQKWDYRKNLFNEVKLKYTARVDTTVLFLDVSKKQLNEKVPRINIAVYEPYVW